jgi:F-type H+-transporting ATPase subunit delta
VIRQSIARRYARGLLAVGEKDGRYRDYLRELDECLRVIEHGPRIERALMLPLLEMDARKELLADIIKALAMESAPAALLGLLLERNRMRYLPLICDAYGKMVDDKEGLVRGVGYSAYPLPETAKTRIEEALGERLAKRVRLDMRQDRSLIGGIKVIVGGLRIDGSVKRQLEVLNERMMKE